MIFGRSPSLWIAAATAVLNALVAIGLVPFTEQQIGVVDTALTAVIYLVAASDIKVALKTTPPKE